MISICLIYLQVEAKEIIDCLKFGKTSKKYKESVRAFSFTLHSYSPRGYNFVRSKFNNRLPNPTCIRSWVSNCTGKCEPGISPESIRAIEMIAKGMKEQGKDFLISLAWDEMSIRRHVSWNEAKKNFIGFISNGQPNKKNEIPVAKEALVFLVTGLNADLSIPIAHYFISGLSAIDKSELIMKIIIEITRAGGKVINVTFDGLANNFACCRLFGASFKLSDLRPYFFNPIDGTKIHITCDACHMFKLIRNCLGSEKRITDGTGDIIEWRFIANLENCRIKNSFVTHKLTKKHIQWYRNKMNVKLAVQTLSNSVAKSIEYLNGHDRPGFKNSAATTKFITIMNNLFDISNTKKCGSNNLFKNPICHSSAEQIFLTLDEASDYIKSLKLNGNNILKCRKRTGM